MSPVTIRHSRRELARRVSGSIEVTLYWHAEDNSTSIEVWRPTSGERFTSVVPREDALDAFCHPFAHPPLSFNGRSLIFEAGLRS